MPRWRCPCWLLPSTLVTCPVQKPVSVITLGVALILPCVQIPGVCCRRCLLNFLPWEDLRVTGCLPGGQKSWGRWGGWAEASGNVLSVSHSSPTFLLPIAHPAWANEEPPVYRILGSVSKPSPRNVLECQTRWPPPPPPSYWQPIHGAGKFLECRQTACRPSVVLDASRWQVICALMGKWLQQDLQGEKLRHRRKFLFLLLADGAGHRET